MNATDETIYKLLLWALPVLISVLAFIGGLAVKSLMKMSNDIGEIKNKLTEVTTKHDELDRRVERLESQIWN